MLAIMMVVIIGASVGSFLNVCIYRLPKRQSIVKPSSHCPMCDTPIAWFHNIPILSFLILRGKCKSCGMKIPFRYIIVEILTAIVFLVLYVRFGITAQFFAYATLAAGLIVSTFVDFEIQEIPDEISLGGLALGIVLCLIFPAIIGQASRPSALIASLSGAFAGGGSIYILGTIGKLIFKKDAMGGGDVKLLAMIGSFIGWKLVLVTFFVAPVFGSVVGIIAKYRYGHETIPYGPYLSLAAFVSIMWGENILRLVLPIY